MEGYISKLTELLNNKGVQIVAPIQISGDQSTLIYGNSGVECVLIFTKEDGKWVFQQQLVASDGGRLDYFGACVATSTDAKTIAVSAPVSDHEGKTSSGSVYFFTKTDSGWIQQAKVVASDATNSAFFGASISLSSDGNIALIGSSATDHSGKTEAGAAYIFTHSGSAWVQHQKLVAGDGKPYDHFGVSVSLSTDGTLATVYNGHMDRQSYAYKNGVWAETSKLKKD